MEIQATGDRRILSLSALCVFLCVTKIEAKEERKVRREDAKDAKKNN
jgi:hypothetical protein